MECPASAYLNLDHVENHTNLTSSQLAYYSQLYTKLICADNALQYTQRISFIISGTIGFFAHVLMAFILVRALENSCTLVCHMAMTIMEIFHMIIMAQYGALRLFEPANPSNKILANWTYLTYNGYYIGDAIKLTVSALTACLSLERMMAVCTPTIFSRVDRKSYAYGAILASVLIGSVHLLAMFTWNVDYDPKTNRYLASANEFSKSIVYQSSIDFIFAAKIGLSLIIFAFCTATAVGLKLEWRRLSLLGGQPKSQWLAKARLCMFSYIVGVCTLIDHVVWVAYKAMSLHSTGLIGEKALLQVDVNFQQIIQDLSYSHLLVCMSLVQALMGELVHSYRLFIYLTLNKTMREGLRQLMGMQTNRVHPNDMKMKIRNVAVASADRHGVRETHLCHS